MTKTCSGCGLEKPVSEFSESRITKDGFRYECRACGTKRAAEWRAKHPEKVQAAVVRYAKQRRERYQVDAEFREAYRKKNSLAYHSLSPEKKRERGRKNSLRTNYNLSPEEYDAMLAAQDGLCACCGRPAKKFEVDHDHDTGKVRGLLCRACNTGVGLLGDSPEGVEKALAYLRRHEEPTWEIDETGMRFTAGIMSLMN